MTYTEKNFYIELKKITDELGYTIIPQLQLQRIFKPKQNKIIAFNKIKSKSIDFTIIDENYKYKLFIELDDYTHNYNNRIKRDNFINELFKYYNKDLIRIKVKDKYDFTEIEEKLKK